ncbi:antibiotic biosynthesis monooxygenase family protein [Phytohalomonas tamaricis]|uniref:antibiotic biosynthesis monooxygenase family protein n=1 Tax=Phytohalomonas tamaricis TaxID=2081032 RepID=UPI000D0B519D|nr:antibiotic biosynthesis monooxygenase family protein [Phytohalomonas tamaricis]
MGYIVTNRVLVIDEYAEEFETRFRKRASEVDKQPGFVAMQVLRPQGNQAPYVVETEWEDQQAFRDWVNSDDFKKAHSNPMPKEAFREGGGIEQFNVIIEAHR